MKTIIKTTTLILTLSLIGCNDMRVSPGQMSTVRDPALYSEGPDLLGGSDTPIPAESAPTYSTTGGGGL